jgi:hypothetical protein
MRPDSARGSQHEPPVNFRSYESEVDATSTSTLWGSLTSGPKNTSKLEFEYVQQKQRAQQAELCNRAGGAEGGGEEEDDDDEDDDEVDDQLSGEGDDRNIQRRPQYAQQLDISVPKFPATTAVCATAGNKAVPMEEDAASGREPHASSSADTQHQAQADGAFGMDKGAPEVGAQNQESSFFAPPEGKLDSHPVQSFGAGAGSRDQAVAELREMMKLRFLNGEDADHFDYSKADEDYSMDDMNQQGQDDQDSWFEDA